MTGQIALADAAAGVLLAHPSDLILGEHRSPVVFATRHRAVTAAVCPVVLGVRAPRQIRHAVVLRSATPMTGHCTGRSWPDEGFKDKLMDRPIGAHAVTVKRHSQVAVGGRIHPQKGASPMPTDTGDPVHTANTTLTADLVQAFPADHWEPSFSRHRWGY